MFSRKHILFFSILLLFFSSCNIKKHIPDNRHLLLKVEVNGAPPGFKSDIEGLVKEEPNSSFLGLFKKRIWIRNKLWIHLKLEKENEKRYRKWVKESFGEAPVYLDSNNTEYTAINIRNFMFNKGYFNASVETDYQLNDKKAYAEINIDHGKPYFIDNIDYFIMDKRIDSLIRTDSLNCLLSPGDQYDSDMLTMERNRITNYLRNKGYFTFSRDFVYFDIDTTLSDQKINVGIGIRSKAGGERHRVYYISEVYVDLDHSIMDTVVKDTLDYENFKFIYGEELVKPNSLLPFLFIRKNYAYNQIHHRRTLSRLAELRIYRHADIQFEIISESEDEPEGFLVCHILLIPAKKQEVIIDTEVLTREENDEARDISSERFYGVAGNLIYRHKNLLSRGLLFESRFGGLLELGSGYFQKEDEFLTNYQIRFGSSLFFPRLLLPFGLDQKFMHRTARTAYNASVLFEENRDYDRLSSSLSMVYQVDTRYYRHLITPLEVSIARTEPKGAFAEQLNLINDPMIRSLYDSRHIIVSSRYMIIYDDRDLETMTDGIFIRFNVIELAGNSLWAINNIFFPDRKKEETPYFSISDLDIYQYVRSEFDIRHYQALTSKSNFVSRFYIGAGHAYGNVVSLPLERRFFIGGTNSLRAWTVRELGPGSYSPPNDTIFVDRTGDIKLEANLEYRFPIVYVFKGAVFVDAGNIWSLTEKYRETEEREGAAFKTDEFISQIAIGTGVGLRLDFSFFVFRVDAGVKVYDPVQEENERWVIKDFSLRNRSWRINNTNLNFGVGYPF